MSAAALPERALIGSCEIRSVLGQGGGGISYLAYDCQLEREVVIKEHFPRTLCLRLPDSAEVQPSDEQSYMRSLNHFCREARILAGLNHPSVVKVYDIFQASGTAYMVMEYVEGETLATWMPEHVQDVRCVEDMLCRLLEALEYVHGVDVLHRDVKPANIIVRDDGLPVLIDFGAAVVGVPDTTHTMIGSPGYAPPEQFQPHGHLGPWSDLYALAHTFLSLIPVEQLKLYRREMVQALFRAGKPIIEERYDSAAAWRLDLQKSEQARAWPWRWICAGLVLAFLLVVGVFVVRVGEGEPGLAPSESVRPMVQPRASSSGMPVHSQAEISLLTMDAQEAYAVYERELIALQQRAESDKLSQEELQLRIRELQESLRRKLQEIAATRIQD